MKDIDAIKALIEQREVKRLMELHGITQEEVAEYKMANEPKLQDADEIINQLFPQDLTDEEVLYYATPYYDELQAKKQLKEEHIKDEVRQ